MAGDNAVDEAMEIESLPSTSHDNTKIKERDVKSANLPWYVLFLRWKILFFDFRLPRYCEFRLSFISEFCDSKQSGIFISG